MNLKSRMAELREYQSGDEDRIIELFRKTYGKEMDHNCGDLEHWNWEFGGEPGAAKYIVLATSGEAVIGQYAVIPRRMWIGGKEVRGSLSLDTMIDAEYRRQCLFPKMGRRLYKRLSEEGVTVTYGFPNENSINSIVKKLGWKELFVLPVAVAPLRPFRIVAGRYRALRTLTPLGDAAFAGLREIFSAIRELLPYRVAEVPIHFGSDFDRLWERSRTTLRIAAVRDAAFLDWRFAKRPNMPYRLVTATDSDGHLAGYLVFRLMDYKGMLTCFIMDLLADENKRTAPWALLAEALAISGREGGEIASAILPRSHRYFPWVLAAGFVPLPERLFPDEIHIGALAHDSAIESIVLNHEAWFLSWADTDLV